MLTPKQDLLARSLLAVTAKTGQFQKDFGVSGAGYVEEHGNILRVRGMSCKNCVLFRGPNSCMVVRGKISDGGLCRLYVIPEAKLALAQPLPAPTACPQPGSAANVQLSAHAPDVVLTSGEGQSSATVIGTATLPPPAADVAPLAAHPPERPSPIPTRRR